MVFKAFSDQGLVFQKMKAQSRLSRYLCLEDQVQVHVLPLFYLRERIQIQHEYSRKAATYLSQGFAAALLLSSFLKNQEKIKMTVQADGPGEGWIAEANAFGEARGYLFRPETFDEPYEELLGKGYLTVTRYLEANRFSPITSTIQGRLGRIATDLEHYALLSDQIESKVVMSQEWAALARPLPGCSPQLWESAVQAMDNMDWKLGPDSDFELRDFEKQLADLPGIRLLDSYRVEFYCPCQRERFAAYLRSLDPKDREEIKENGPFPVDIRCHYCNTHYLFSREELDAMFGDA